MSEFKIIGTIDTLISTDKEVKFLMKFKNKYEDLNEKKYVLFEVIKEKKDECKIEDKKEEKIKSKEFIAIKKKDVDEKYFTVGIDSLDKMKECKNEGKKIQITIELKEKNNKNSNNNTDNNNKPLVLEDEIVVKEVEILW